MAPWLQVLTVTLVLISSVLSFQNPEADSSILQIHQLKPKINTLKGEVEVNPDYVDELNEMISQYMLTFELKKSEIKDEKLLKVLDTIKLLIAQSWIKTLKPDPDLVTLVGTDLETLTENIRDKLEQGNIKLPVVDAILTFSLEIEPMFTKSFENKRKYLENADEIVQEHVKKAASARNEIDADHLKSSWKGVFYTLNQINGNLVIHRMAHRMYIQSYMLNFIPENKRPSEKILLIATDKKRSKKFRVPPLVGMDIFSDILLGDPEEVDKLILNRRISQYFKIFKEERKVVSDVDDLRRAMDVVKLLIVQGWIDKLNPPSQFVLPEYIGKNKEDIKDELMQINGNYPVKDAILLYTDDKEQAIERNFIKQQTRFKEMYENIQSDIRNVPTNHENEEMNELENKMNEVQGHLVAHRIVKLFYLHSYQENFVAVKSETLQLRSSKGSDMRSFKVPPINLYRFYENPLYD